MHPGTLLGFLGLFMGSNLHRFVLPRVYLHWFSHPHSPVSRVQSLLLCSLYTHSRSNLVQCQSYKFCLYSVNSKFISPLNSRPIYPAAHFISQFGFLSDNSNLKYYSWFHLPFQSCSDHSLSHLSGQQLYLFFSSCSGQNAWCYLQLPHMKLASAVGSTFKRHPTIHHLYP